MGFSQIKWVFLKTSHYLIRQYGFLSDKVGFSDARADKDRFSDKPGFSEKTHIICR